MTLPMTLDELAAALPGGALRPDDPGYAGAVTTMIGDGTPELVVRPRSTDEVVATVRFVREHDLPLTVRAGGHSVAGLTTAPDGVLLDLRQMDRVDVDPPTRLVHVGGGATWGAVARAVQPHGLGITAGDTANVGVGGLTLGGGIGWMVRRHGLAIDSLVGAEVVTADGQVLQVSAMEHPDLFWALRGGGGTFGVVTRFDFIAQHVGDVVFGTVVYALDNPESVLTAWREAQRDADERLTTVLSLQPAWGDQPATAMLRLCFAGSEADAAGVLGPLFDIGAVLSSDVAVRPYGDVLEDVAMPGGMKFAVRSALLPELGAAERTGLAGLFRDGGTMVSLRALGGAVSRVAPEATAFAHRPAEVMAVAMRMLPADAGPDDETVPGWDSIAARSTGAYVNFLSAGADGAEGYPPEAIARLTQVKADYDPENVFERSVDIRREVMP